MRSIHFIILTLIATLFYSCSSSSSNSSDSNDSDNLLDTNVKLLSSSLASASKIATNKPGTFQATSGSACSASSTSCTPTNLGGRIFSGGPMLGELGNDAFNITMLGATDEIIQDPSTGIGGSLEFSLIEATTLTGKYAVPSEEDMPASPIITRMEFNYDYLDATFTLENTGAANVLDKTFIIRTVFVTEATANDVSGTMIRGDKLIRTNSETSFRWCNTTSCSANRSDVAEGLIQESKLVNYEFPGQGNENYIPFTVPIEPTLTVTYDELTAEGNVWSVDFSMTNAIIFETAPNALTTESGLLESFELSYEPSGDNNGQQTEISAGLSITPNSGGAGVLEPIEEEDEE